MNRNLFILTLAAALTISAFAAFLLLPSQAQTTIQPPDGAVSVTAANVSSRINYQGVLREGGSLVNGNRNFTFQFYTVAGCTTPAGSLIVLNGVAVANGLFSVKLDVDQALFNGQGLWLGVRVGSTGSNTACEEITPVPYALSLRPGAVIVGNIAGSPVISVTNTYSPTVGSAAVANGESSALSGQSKIGPAVLGSSEGGAGVHGQSTSGVGVYALSRDWDAVRGWSTNGNGGYFQSQSSSAYGLVAGNTNGKAARFDGGVDINGDVNVAGEVYAKSLHTKSGKTTTSGVTTTGDGTFKSVTVPPQNDPPTGGKIELKSDGTVSMMGPTGSQVFKVDGTGHGTFKGGVDIPQTDGGIAIGDLPGTFTMCQYNAAHDCSWGIGDDGATFPQVSLPRAGGGQIEIAPTGLNFKDSASNSKASIGSNGDTSLKSVTVPQTDGGKIVIDPDRFFVQSRSGVPQAVIFSMGDYMGAGVFNGLSTKNPDNGITGGIITANGAAIFKSLTVTGPKSAAVSTASYGERKLYSDESAEIYFFDRGGGQLGNGVAVIALDPIWLETVTIDASHPMQVQVTLTDDCNGVYVAEKTATSFTVRELLGGKSNATFDWEVAAKRKGYEDVRLESMTVR